MAKDVTSLDLDTIKANLQTYLSQQTEFKDFNFDGSAISTLLDLLSYFIQYTAYYVNANFNEMFLETAELRENVVTIAKSLGYFPHRKSCANTPAILKFNENINIQIPSGTKFTGTNVNNTEYPFETRVIYNLDDTNNYQASIELYQQTTEIYDTTFDINYPYIDLSYGKEIDSLYVYVNNELWNFYDFNLNLTKDSKVYFLEENTDNNQNLRITFGNNVFGKQPDNGSTIEVKMYLTEGSLGNGISDIELSEIVYDSENNPRDKDDFTLTLSYSTSGAQDEETIDEIKVNAAKNYESQNRLVTKNDYKALLNTIDFVDIFNVWGGEEFSPPVYGTVYLTIKPNGGLVLDDTQKQTILDAIEEKQIVSLRPKIIDSEYINFDLNVTAYYYRNQGLSTNDIENNIMNTLQSYIDNSLNFYDSILKYSQLLELVNNVEGISHNEIDIKTYSILTQNPVNAYTISLYNKVLKETFASDDFVDDGNGNIVNISDATIIGTINYDNGIIKFDYDIPDNYKVYYILDSNDMIMQFNTLLNLNDINVTLYPI